MMRSEIEVIEMETLGSALLSEEYFARVIKGNLLGFEVEKHETIFQAMVDVADDDEPVNLITVTNKLKDQGKLDEVGGPAYLASLTSIVPVDQRTDYY